MAKFKGWGAERQSLRVKIKSLAAEARIIRHEEKRTRDDTRRGCLTWHRINDVRNEARAAQLAYAFLRGRPYAEVKTLQKCGHPKPFDYKRIESLVKKYGSYGAEDGVRDWLKDY